MDLGEAHAFSSDDKSIIDKNLNVKKTIDIDSSEIDEYFELASVSNWIKENQYKRVYRQTVMFSLETVRIFAL